MVSAADGCWVWACRAPAWWSGLFAKEARVTRVWGSPFEEFVSPSHTFVPEVTDVGSCGPDDQLSWSRRRPEGAEALLGFTP